MAYDDDGIGTGIHRQILSANTTVSTAVAAIDGTGGLQHPLAPLIHEDILWQMNLSVDETMEGGPYPERPGQPDCAYYMRTGICRFGMTCKFNHPLHRKMAIATARMKGSYPERIGQPECQYYLKTGTCKFGATCKFHHPRERTGLASKVQLNDLGYPLRPNEIECAYYLRTGQCKFGNTCKFHHPQPSDLRVPISGSIYPTVHSPSTGQHSYPGALSNWSMPRASYIPSPRWQGPSNYAQVILPQGLVQVSGWNAYTGQLGSASSTQNEQHTRGSAQFYGSSRHSEISSAGSPGVFSSYGMGSIPVGLYGLQREGVFPERPGEPECQFYMKTGDCKYGAVCRFHHPRERVVPIPDCMLSPLGLPLRPGEPVCVFYSRYGICKFGSNCKFDHPTTIFPYSIDASPSTNVPVKSFVGSSSGTPALPLSQGPASTDAKISRRLSLPEPRKLVSDEETAEAEG